MAPSWYTRLADWNVESLFARAPPPRESRTVFVGQDLPPDYFDAKGRPKKEHVYITNQVVTSKYTILTFVPRNLLEQFRRVANVFFLAIDILQFFPKFRTISPGLVIIPLVLVIGITGGKDGYEDVKRHQADRVVNHSQTLVLEGGGWANPNRMGAKAKTFVKGILPKKRKNAQPGDVDKAVQQEEGAMPDVDTDVEYDAEDVPHSPRSAASHHSHTHPPREPPHWKRTIWEDVRVGDFVKVRNNESIPADILICATSEDENVAFVETKNLDGETNLKSRHAVQALSSLRTARQCADSKQAHFKIDCEAPDVNMYKLNAAVIAPDVTHPIDLQTTLLRGTVLRNTKWVIGVVLFTGADTKITLNSGCTPSKRSKVERQMNPQVFINLILLAIMAVVCGIVDALIEQKKYPESAPWLYDDNRSSDNPQINGLVTWANAFITFQNIIPISLYLSIEFVRTAQAAFIYFDHQIYYEKTEQRTLARSWNLSDDLGQVQYVFSDKTGTLTQNAMIFRQCSIAGQLYTGDPQEDITVVKGTPFEEKPFDSLSSPSDATTSTPPGTGDSPPDGLSTKVKLSSSVLAHFHDVSLSAAIRCSTEADADPGFSRSLNGFFAVLALCHTVVVSLDPETHAIEYRAQSPDEAALVQAAADVGFIFRGRDREILRLETPFSDHVEEYQLMNVLDFTSARKRMSVIVRKLEPGDQRLFLLTKGADNVIFERLRKDENAELKATTERHLEEFANEGLRTLCLAYKVIPEEVYAEWEKRYHNATVALNDRDEQVDQVSAEIEYDLRLLGATAIEDKLQDGVPDTIADLKRAGIKLWVLTGDKLETAIAIGYSTNLVGNDSNLIVVRGGEDGHPYSAANQMLEAVDKFFPDAGIVETVQAKGLEIPKAESSFKRPRTRRSMSGASDLIGSNNGDRAGGFVLVIDGAALSHALSEPFSKELLLQLAIQCEAVICCRVSPLQKALVVKLVKDGLNTMTLAIGDGANDVSMIQAADVGVGIRGEEGLQAVNASDYAISQFRFLKRLLLVHGHWSYARNGNMIINFFYKNIVCIGVLWWFQIYCAWSTQYVFEYTYLLFWNVFWTLCPVIAIGIFDRFIDADVLMAIPELYQYGRKGKWYGTRLFSIYMLDGIYQSAVIYFIITYAYRVTSARHDGFEGYIYEFSTAIVIATVMAANAFNGLNTHAWTGWVWFAVSIGIILVWAYTGIYSLIAPGWIYVPVYGNAYFLFRSALFWFSILIAFCLALLPRFLFKSIQRQYWPTDIDIVKEIRLLHPEFDIQRHPLLGGRNKAREHITSADSGPSSRSASRLRSYSPHGLGIGRPSMEAAGRSVTDMSLGGVQSTHRGFDFASEEGGVHIRRMQSNLSERRMQALDADGNLDAPRAHNRHRSISLFPSLRRNVRRRMRSSNSPKPTTKTTLNSQPPTS
ncbi:phospholipid-translocating P-type ATPase [Ramaria rubella]|nr:phospholipid-translocating P-type ATPase [Ramaria rubella]